MRGVPFSDGICVYVIYYFLSFPVSSLGQSTLGQSSLSLGQSTLGQSTLSLGQSSLGQSSLGPPLAPSAFAGHPLFPGYMSTPSPMAANLSANLFNTGSMFK